MSWYHKLYANIFGYFWLPCPLCRREFSGHAWRKWGYACIKTEHEGSFIAICQKCTDAGLADWDSRK
jgi:hypothetical protein